MYNDRNTEINRKITHMYSDSLTLRVLAYISSHDPDLSHIYTNFGSCVNIEYS